MRGERRHIAVERSASPVLFIIPEALFRDTLRGLCIGSETSFFRFLLDTE